MLTNVQRYDAGKATKITRTPQGGVRVDAVLTGVGVFPYRNADGTTRLEFRPPEEVLKADSIASLSGAPVTRDHPGMVSAENWTTLARGHVHGDARADGSHIVATLAVQDAGMVRDVLAKPPKLSDVSCGYTCRIDETPGVYNGQRYDVAQRDIVYNHVGLGPAGWGRQGSEVSLRLDSGGAIMDLDDSATPRHETLPQGYDMIKVRVDGIEYDAGSQSHLDAVAKREAALEARASEANARADKAEGERDDARKAASEAQAKVDAFDKEVDARADARVKLREDARKVLGAKADLPATERAIMEAVVKHDAKDAELDGKSDDYVRARFDSAVERAGTASKNPGNATIKDFRQTMDAGEGKPEDKRDAREKFLDESRNAWKKPLAATAGKD